MNICILYSIIPVICTLSGYFRSTHSKNSALVELPHFPLVVFKVVRC